MTRSAVVIACMAASILVRAQEPATAKVDRKLLEEDFRIARSALETGHAGIYRYTPKAELDKDFDAIAKQITQPMTPLEFFRLLTPIVGDIKCGHTAVNPPRDVQRAMTTSIPLFPFDVEVLGGKVYVSRDYSPDVHGVTGLEIRRINGVAIDNILPKMMATVSGDGDSQTAKPWRLGHDIGFARRLYSVLGIESPFQVEFRDPASGKARELGVSGGLTSDMLKVATARYPQEKNPDSAANLKFLENGDIALLKVYGFGGKAGQEKKPLSQFFDDAFAEIHTRNSKTLILDLRDNGGGEDALGKQLLSYLLDQPFQYYDDLIFNAREFDFFRYTDGARPVPENMVEKRADGKYHFTKHPNSGLQQAREPHFAGKVLVLMNGGSFSTTCEFLSNLHYRKRATFIGQEAAGGYYGNSSGATAAVVLPNSKVVVRVPLMTYYLAVKGGDPKRSILPDYEVARSVQDLLTDDDKVLAKALDLAHPQPK